MGDKNDGAGAVALIIGIIMIVVGYILYTTIEYDWLGFGYYIYRDEGWMLIMLGILIAVIGIVVALIPSQSTPPPQIHHYPPQQQAPPPPQEQQRICLKCGQYIPSNSVFCPFCGVGIQK